MISEREFACEFTSFWKTIIPLGDVFVKQLNLCCDRFSPPIASSLSGQEERAVINELSFRLFKGEALGILDETNRINIAKDVIRYISNISSSPSKLSSDDMSVIIAEADNLSKALSSYLQGEDFKSIIFNPVFAGCGRVDICQGDMFYKNKLVEIKAGGRNFRLLDIKQVITYLTLNFSSKQYDIQHVAFVNPRQGLAFEMSVAGLIESCSGRKPVDIFLEIIDFISFDQNSK